MIETYKILSEIYDGKICKDLFVIKEDTSTRGHSKKIHEKVKN